VKKVYRNPYYALLAKKRERKRLKREVKGVFYKGDGMYRSTHDKNTLYLITRDQSMIKRFRSDLITFFHSKDFIKESQATNETIFINQYFSLHRDYKSTISKIKEITSAISNSIAGKITIDFRKCFHAGHGALFVLKVIMTELEDELERLNKRLYVTNSIPEFDIIESENADVNSNLILFDITRQKPLPFRNDSALKPVSSLGILMGNKSQKKHQENKKGVICDKIIEYINNCLNKYEYKFTPEGRRYMSGMISEILNNSEDHSSIDTYYATANFSQEEQNDSTQEITGQLNLEFLNWGFSIYEGFEDTKEGNFEAYDTINTHYEVMKSQNRSFNFTKENIFTLTALQDGVSRLKYVEKSRGTGTMKFINSFFSFGDYEDSTKEFSPQLTIFSGNTMLICDNKYKPFKQDNIWMLSLNEELDVKQPPESTHLLHTSDYFPGTMLSVRLFLNKSHITKKISNGNKNN
jgi:hypothetical protein